MPSRAQLIADLKAAFTDLETRATDLDAEHVAALTTADDANIEDLRQAVDSIPDDDVRDILQDPLDDIEHLAVQLYLQSVTERKAHL